MDVFKAMALGALIFAVPMDSLAHETSNLISLEDKEDVNKNITNVKVVYNAIAEQISVSFKLSKQSVVSVKLMDALGNEVLTLQSNSNLDAGNHSNSFETSEKVTAGFYFVRVTSGVETIVKRISIK